MSSDPVVRERALGAVLGSAAGDALGAPFEFGPAGAYRQRFPKPVVGGIGEQVGGGGFGWAAGEFTDDTQMAIVQARSLLDRGGFDGADAFERFRVWARTATDVGIQTHAALSSGLPWDEAARDYFARNPDRSAGNGALMRATPSAVHFARADVDASMRTARDLAALTHGDPSAQWGAALYHAMLHAAIHGDDPFAVLAELLQSVTDLDRRFAETLDPGWDPRLPHVANGSVWGCLAEAVWAVRSTNSFSDALVAAIELGGDTDTVAAVAGGIAGARYGIQAVPSRWTTYLHGYVPDHDGPIRNADLQALTHELLGQDEAPAQPLGTPIPPIEIAPELFAANLAGAATSDRSWAVVSLCRVGQTFAEHATRRELYLVDQEGHHNADLAAAVTDALDTIDAFLDEDRTVIVHCHGGASRTGLVLRAWLMRTHGWDEPTATDWLAERWPALDLWNGTFTRFLRSGWIQGSGA